MPNVGKLSQPKPKKKKKPTLREKYKLYKGRKAGKKAAKATEGMVGFESGAAVKKKKKQSLRAKAKESYTKYKGKKAGKKAAKQTKGMGGFESPGSITKQPKKSKFQLIGRPKTKTYREKNVGVEKTEGGKYPTYKKGGKAAGSFKSEFAKRCVKGATGFTWQGRKYSCAKK